MSNDTPRTDEFARSGDASAEDWTDFARDLERDLAAAQQEIIVLNGIIRVRSDLLATAQEQAKEANRSEQHAIAVLKSAERDYLARLEAAQEQLRVARENIVGIEFSAGGYCPACSGWEVEKGRGCKPKVHTKDCWLAALKGKQP